MDTRTTDLLTDAHLNVVVVGILAIVHYEATRTTITLHFAGARLESAPRASLGAS
jgi:hypothetical protein